MNAFAGPPVKFTISDRAIKMIAIIRSDSRLYKKGDPPTVLGVSWGTHYNNAGHNLGEGVVVGFYTKSQTQGFKGKFYQVSGIPVVIGGTDQEARRFYGKVLDYDEDSWFFLRYPDSNSSVKDSPESRTSNKAIKI